LAALAVAVQIHLSALALVPATLLLLALFWRRVSWKDVAIGAGLGAVTAVPFFIYLSQQSGRIGEGLAKAGGGTRPFSLDALLFARMISVGSDIRSLVGAEQVENFLAQAPPMDRIHWLVTGVLAAGLIYLGVVVVRQWGSRKADIALIVLVWSAAPPLFFLFWRSSPVYLHYFIVLLPAPYLAAGMGFADWQAWFELRHMRIINWVVLAGLAFYQVRYLMALFAFVGQTATPGGFGTPLAYQLEAADTAVSLLTESGAAEVLAVGVGENPELDAFPAVWDVLLREVPHRFVDGTASAVFPAQAAVVVVSEQVGDEAALYRETAAASHPIPLRDGEGEMTILTLSGDAPQPDAAFAEPYLLANFVRFTGYDELDTSTGSVAVWQIYWQTADNPDPAEYHIFNHLLDGRGAQISQADGPAFSGAQWRPGDVVVSRFELPWTENGTQQLLMRTGMYTFDAEEPVLLLDEAGNPYTDAVEILLTVEPAACELNKFRRWPSN
jgi:hypothetical protein